MCEVLLKAEEKSLCQDILILLVLLGLNCMFLEEEMISFIKMELKSKDFLYLIFKIVSEKKRISKDYCLGRGEDME